jgi:hypothetical protein
MVINSTIFDVGLSFDRPEHELAVRRQHLGDGEKLEAAGCQRDAMFPARLHAARRHRPGRLFQIDLVPFGRQASLLRAGQHQALAQSCTVPPPLPACTPFCGLPSAQPPWRISGFPHLMLGDRAFATCDWAHVLGEMGSQTGAGTFSVDQLCQRSKLSAGLIAGL